MACWMSGIPGPWSSNVNSIPIFVPESIFCQRITPEPAYRKTLRGSSEAAVTIRVTSVTPNPTAAATLRTSLRAAAISPSELIGTVPRSSVAPTLFSFVAPPLECVQCTIHIEGAEYAGQGQTQLRRGDRNTGLHAYKNRAPAHQCYHLDRFCYRAREERIEGLHSRNV